MAHLDTTYNSLTIADNGFVSVRKHITMHDEDENIVANANEKIYFQKNEDISSLPTHFQEAINAFWLGVVEETETTTNDDLVS